MRLIGIKINQAKTEDHIKRCLKDEWYPFGDFEDVSKVKDYDKYVEKLKNRNSNGLYFITGEGGKKIDVNISCIVGKNGSGKSTIIDVLLAIINNCAKEYLSNYVKAYNSELMIASDLNASLFYEIKGVIYEIHCNNTNENSIIELYRNQVKVEKEGEKKLFAEQMFYTVLLNYSLYSFNTKDYCFKPEEKHIDSDTGDYSVWISRLFHKNDGYVSPIVLNPFRNMGKIDVNKEDSLAYQRLSAIALCNRDFIPGYIATYLLYKLNRKYEGDVPSVIYDWDKDKVKSKEGNRPSCAYQIIFMCIKANIQKRIKVRKSKCPQKEMLCNYMAYKVMKIAKNYADFKNCFDIEECWDYLDRCGQLELGIDYKNKIINLLNKILEDNSHITYKFHQAWRFISDSFPYNAVNPSYEEYERCELQQINNKSKLAYWKAMSLLPPPIFDMDIEFTSEIGNSSLTFSKMSSGERQLLFSLSSIMYHVKNIESIRKDENRIPYRNINIILDEVELYSHPEYQRDYIKGVLDRLSWIKIDSQKIDSINILVVTHSPFILSDICKENTLYLENGRRKETELTDSFGANYYDLLLNGFFLQEGGAVGAWAAEVFKSIVASKESTNTLQLEDDQKIKFAELFGDPLVSGVLKRRIIEIENKNKKKKS